MFEFDTGFVKVILRIGGILSFDILTTCNPIDVFVEECFLQSLNIPISVLKI